MHATAVLEMAVLADLVPEKYGKGMLRNYHHIHHANIRTITKAHMMLKRRLLPRTQLQLATRRQRSLPTIGHLQVPHSWKI